MIHKPENDMTPWVNAALQAGMAGFIGRARLRNLPLVVSRDGKVVEIYPQELKLQSPTDEPSETPSGIPAEKQLINS